MNKRERVAAALTGAAVDRVPIGFWGHFPSDPRRADPLVAETLRFQRRFDWDFVKLMPTGVYVPEALGCQVTPASGPDMVSAVCDSIVKRPEDWERVPVLDPHTGWLAEHLMAIRQVRDALGPEIFILQTLFSPLAVAHKMSVHLPFLESVRDHRETFEAGLRLITESTLRFAEASLDAGADGFFYAVQDATRDGWTDAEFLELGKRHDLEILQAVEGLAGFTLLHVCRNNIMADLVADYPVHAVNWECNPTNPSLAEARRMWRQTLVGGLDRNGVLLTGTPDDVKTEVRRVIRETGTRKFIVSAGCTLPAARPDANLMAARRAVEIPA
jgi:uroporphyrinogen decarboxylase